MDIEDIHVPGKNNPEYVGSSERTLEMRNILI